MTWASVHKCPSEGDFLGLHLFSSALKSKTNQRTERQIKQYLTSLSSAVVDLIRCCCTSNTLTEKSVSLTNQNFVPGFLPIQDWDKTLSCFSVFPSKLLSDSDTVQLSWTNTLSLVVMGRSSVVCGGFPSDDNTREETGPGQDHSHVFSSVWPAGPPPQRDSPCVGGGDLSHCYRPTHEFLSARAHVRPPPPDRVTLRSSAFTFCGFKCCFSFTAAERHWNTNLFQDFLPDATFSLSLMQSQSTFLQGNIISGL